MSKIVVGNDIGATVAKQLGLVTESGATMSAVKRIIIFLASGPDQSPWDYIQYDGDAIVIRVWDPQDQIAVCEAFNLNASDLHAALIDLEWDSIAKVVYHGFLKSNPERDALGVLEAIIGSPLTSTHLPAGPLSAHGVRVPGYVVEGNRDITAGAQGERRPYRDLELP